MPNEITHSTWTWLLVGLPALVACGCGHDAAAPTGLSEVPPHAQPHGRPPITSSGGSSLEGSN